MPKKETKTEESDVPVISWYVPSDDQPDKQVVLAEANKIIEVPKNKGSLPTTTCIKLAEAAESKICCICKKPFDGYGNNAEPVCSGTCCDKCNIERVIPMRFKMIKNIDISIIYNLCKIFKI